MSMTQAANTYAQALYDLAKEEGLGKSILEELCVLKGVFADTPQYSKLLSDIPQVDVVITMGCNVQCPFLPCSHREDWGLEDPQRQARRGIPGDHPPDRREGPGPAPPPFGGKLRSWTSCKKCLQLV